MGLNTNFLLRVLLGDFHCPEEGKGLRDLQLGFDALREFQLWDMVFHSSEYSRVPYGSSYNTQLIPSQSVAVAHAYKFNGGLYWPMIFTVFIKFNILRITISPLHTISRKS